MGVVTAFQNLISSLGLDPGVKGRNFERFVQWFLKNDPEWSSIVDEVWLWEQYPGRWGPDCGVDLIFRSKSNEIWAVQAKCYAATTTITKEDVDKFLSESNRSGIDKRLLIATTDRVGANARQVCDAQEKSVVRFLLSDFLSARLTYPDSIDQLSQGRRHEPPKPRPHQLEAIERVADGFKENARGQLLMACGTGKTFTTLWLKEKINATRTLVLLPSIGLLAQTLREWTYAATAPFDVLCICSDTSAGNAGDEVFEKASDVPFPVTSKIGEIREFLLSERKGQTVIFCTYQSSHLIAECQQNSAVAEFDLVVSDEAHRCAGKVESCYSVVLDGEKIRSKKRLFATATPRTYSALLKKSAKEVGVDIAGMDDSDAFGPVLYSLSFREAIAQELLTDYKVIVIGVGDESVADMIEKRKLLHTESGVVSDAEEIAGQIGLIKAIKNHDIHRIISFHSRISRAKKFANEISALWSLSASEREHNHILWSDFVSGEMPASQRKIKLDRLRVVGKNECGLLTNARCLSEGIDVPSLDGVCFVDPRSSQIDIIQAVGRAIRRSFDKKFGAIILPVFIRPSDDPEIMLDSSAFKPVWDVINALKSHDQDLAIELDKLRTELGKSRRPPTKGGYLEKIIFDMPVGVPTSFAEHLYTRFIEGTTSPWSQWYGELLQYVDEHGTSNVPKPYQSPLTKVKLGQWVASQRATKANGNLERQALLSTLPGWSWSPRDEQWERAYELLRAYVDQNNHSRVPDTFASGDFQLGAWVGVQRRSWARLNESQKLKLGNLPGWTLDAREAKWQEMYGLLCDYVKEFGTARVPNKYSYKNVALGSWVGMQRTYRSTLSPERGTLLESLDGWSWDPFVDGWEKGYEHLLAFVAEHGHSRVPVSPKYVSADGFALTQWVQKQKNKKNLLSDSQREKLENLPEWEWNFRLKKWNEGFALLKQYKAANGTLDVPACHITQDGFKLGLWVRQQRWQWADGLSEYARKRLLELPGWSSYVEDRKSRSQSEK